MNEIEAVETCDAYLLIDALMWSGKHTETQLDTALAVVGLSATKWNVLRHLVVAGGQLPLGQLAARLSCVKSNATQLVDRLVAEQWVCRLPDPEDRRSIRAQVTAAGRARYEAGLKVVSEFEGHLLDDYSADERLLLSKLLARLGGIESSNG